MATLIQQCSGGAGSGTLGGSGNITSGAAGFANATVNGNLLILVAYGTSYSYAGNPTIHTPVNSGGYSTAWTKANQASFGNAVDGGAGTVAIYYINNAPSMSPSQTITLELSTVAATTLNVEFDLYEFSNASTIKFDFVNSGQTVGTPHVSFVGSTSTEDLIITALIAPDTGSNISAGTGYTLGINTSTLYGVGQMQYALAVPSGATSSSFLGTEPTYWGAVSAGFLTTLPTPTVSSVSPSSGTQNGGTLVTLTGTNFVSGAVVTFGGVAATSIAVVSSTTITCVTPANIVGACTVSVTTSGGTGSFASYTYTPYFTILITGGNFQDAAGNPMAGGYVTFRLNTDATAVDCQISAGRLITFPLDSNGNLSGYIWPNDQLTPATVYIVRAYNAAGELVWNNQMSIPSGMGAFDIGSWVPSNL
jgi:hypothetical protein